MPKRGCDELETLQIGGMAMLHPRRSYQEKVISPSSRM